MPSEVALTQQLRSQIQSLLRVKHQLLVQPAERPVASQLLSHIGGDPYFEQGEAWPTNPETGQPLELIFQLVSDGALPWPFAAQVVQFYHNYYAGDLPFDANQPLDFRLKIYPELRPERQVLVARPAALPPLGFSALTFHPAPSLPDDEELPDISPATVALCQQLAPADWQQAYNEMVTELAGEPDFGSWVGGYAQWLQGAYPTGTFWLQFDSTREFSWGDAGLLYFFADETNPTDISFQLQCC